MNQQNWAGSGYGAAPPSSFAGAHPVIPHPATHTATGEDGPETPSAPQEETWPPRVASTVTVPVPAGYPTQAPPPPARPTAVPTIDQPSKGKNPRPAFTGTAADLVGIGETARPATKAQRGWRRNIRVLSAGLIAPAPGAEETSQQRDHDLVCSQWSRPMTVTIASPKGGVGKTTTTVGVAAVFGELRGGGVLAWDNNETLGTLGIRTKSGRFHTTVVDLLENIDSFEDRHASRGDLGGYLRYQESGHFDVLASDEDPGQMATLGAAEFNRIHDVVSRFQQLIAIDTGNNPRAKNFIAALDRTDVLVIPLQWTADRVQSAGRLMDQLRRTGHGDLVDTAVVAVTHDGGKTADPKTVAAWRDWFVQTTSGVYEIPYDQHLAEGDSITYSRLSDRTRRAYLRLAASIADGLNTQNGWIDR